MMSVSFILSFGFFFQRPTPIDLRAQLRADVGQILLAVLFVSVGVAVLILAGLRRRFKDLSLVSFGVCGVLYGVRLFSSSGTTPLLFDVPPILWVYTTAFITYAIPVPFVVFLEQFMGRGWKSSIRRLWQLQGLYAVVAIPLSGFRHNPWEAGGWNNSLVILIIVVIFGNLFHMVPRLAGELKVFWAGVTIFMIFILNANLVQRGLLPWRWTAEPIGLLIFIGFLGYAVAHRFFTNEKQLLAIEQEMATARRIQSSILPQQMPKVPGIHLAARYLPMAAVAGDFYDFLVLDGKGMGILVADVSGHGVPAALIASMVKVSFASQAPQASDPARVLTGMNQIFCGKFEREFITAGYLLLDMGKRKLVYAGAGHPSPLLLRRSQNKIYELSENGLIMGQFPEAHYVNTELDLGPGDRILLYTDGILEATNSSGEFFGEERLKRFLEAQEHRSPGRCADALLERLFQWSGKRAGETLDDDLTLIVVDIETPAPSPA
jgi:sigma-B regulation protein RsbU (phosphoserine phosphatase)